MSKAGQITVLIIDDSFFMRKLLSDLLESDSGIQVIGKVKNGKEGLQKIKELKPDVVTLDYKMLGWDGIQTLRKIMKECPTPVIMISAYAKKDAELTLQALEEGAVDYLLKPSGEVSWDIEQIKNEIIRRVKTASLVKVSKLKALLKEKHEKIEKLAFKKTIPLPDKIVAIGASSGGPNILKLILRRLPKNFPSAILIVQHMPKVFTGLFAKNLDNVCDIQVKEAEQGEVIQKGIVYIAPGGWHMEVEKKEFSGYFKGVIMLNKLPPIDNLRPSIDILMNSVAEAYKGNAIGVILTGMGQDGVEGIKAINEIGGETIAQDEATSMIFGMPKKAIESGVINEVLPANKIPVRLIEIFTK